MWHPATADRCWQTSQHTSPLSTSEIITPLAGHQTCPLGHWPHADLCDWGQLLLLSWHWVFHGIQSAPLKTFSNETLLIMIIILFSGILIYTPSYKRGKILQFSLQWNYVPYSHSPLYAGNMFQDTQWMSEIIDCNKPHIYYVFSYS